MNDASAPPKRLLIGDLILDMGKREVSRRDERLDLPKLSYRLLLALVETAPNVVSQDELIERVWPGRVVSPETLTQRIKLTRRALGDDASDPRYIGVVRGEGYRLLPAIDELPPADSGVTRGLLAELSRRRVLQTALVYAAIAWSITEVLSFLLDALPVFPGWSKTLVAIVFVVGFPVAMFLAWRFDLGPGGIKRVEAATREGRVTIAAALLLMFAATAGLFYLIYPHVVENSGMPDPLSTARVGVADDNAIAVLPFVNASENADDLYISEGLGDELRDQLGRIDGIRVAARSSSVIFRESSTDAVAIAKRLHVGKLIEGTLRREGQQLRISVQIVDGTSGYQIWTSSFNRTARDLLDIQRDIAQEVVRELLPERDQDEPVAEPGSLDATAHELMLLARHYYHEVREQSIVDMATLLKSIDLYRQATEIDPNSALAHSRLGAALLYLGDVEAAEPPISRALSINPDISEVQYTLGLYNWMRYVPGTGDAHRRAVELNPNNADALEAYGKWIWHQLITDEAEPYLQRALEIDPMSLSRYADLGSFYGMSGMRDKARALATQVPARFSDANAFMVVARILELAGDVDAAIAWALEARKLAPDRQETRWMVAELYARIGDFEAAHHFENEPAFNLLYWERRYEEMLDLGEELVLDQPNQAQLWYGLARAYVATGRFEQAIHVLRSQNIPEHVFNENRRANGEEALVTLADAYAQTGNVEAARELATWATEHFGSLRDTGAHHAWWPYLYIACARSILQQDELALESLEAMTDSWGMPWYPVLVDSPCFRKLSGRPRYEAVVRSVEEQKRNLRERLPDTLARFQVPE